MRILLTGASGMLGRRLAEALGCATEVTRTARRAAPGIRALDVADEAAVLEAVSGVRPDVIVNAAAFTGVDLAESRPLEAHRTNAAGPGILARAAAGTGAWIVHVSTDFVFDGEAGRPYVETDAPNPLSVYGLTKLAGEEAVRTHADRWTILRTQWLYGPDGRHFAGTILRLAREGRPLRVVGDQRGSPTFTRDVAAIAARLLDLGATGIVHAANAGVTSWHGFARRVLDRAGLAHVPIAEITTAEYPAPARRPAFSALRNARLEALGLAMRPWQDALDEFLSEPSAVDGRSKGEL